MRISVVIPTFNSERTIRMTLKSLFRQTVSPDEILIVDDGSTDSTISILESYKPRITVFRQEHGGLTRARNELWKHTRGSMCAFLDSDDIWHPRYLETQWKAFEQNPSAALFFTGHYDFGGYGDFDWGKEPSSRTSGLEHIRPAAFLRRYYRATGPFISPSLCCVRREALLHLEAEPFKIEGAEDTYLFTLIPLFGWSVVYDPTPLVAYRFTDTSYSANAVRSIGRSMEVFEALMEAYLKSAEPKLLWEFRDAYALRKRMYAKLLMGVGRASEARKELISSLRVTRDVRAHAKSFGLLLRTYLPRRKWRRSYRGWDIAQGGRDSLPS